MKKLISFFILFSLLVLTGCEDNETLSHINESIPSVEKATSESSEMSGKKLNIDKEAQPVGIIGDYYIFTIDSDNYNDTANHAYWKYSLTTGEKTEIGTIYNTTSASAINAFLKNGKGYFTTGVVKNDVPLNQHYEIDLHKNSLTVLSEDDFFPPLVDTIAINDNQYVELQPEIYGEGLYKYHIKVGNGSEMKEILYKVRTSEPEFGEMITCISSFNNTLYTFEYQKYNRFICSYDLTGKELSKDSIDLVNDFLDIPDQYTGDPEILWSMNVVRNYYFFSTMNRKTLVIKRDGRTFNKIDSLSVDYMSIVKQSNCIDTKQTRLLLCDGANKKYYLFNIETEKIEEVKLNNSEKITYAIYDGVRMIYIDENNETYFIDI